MRVRYTPRADSDIKRILGDLNRTSPRAAARAARTLKRTIELAGQFPASGRVFHDLGIRVRPTTGLPYLVFWMVTSDAVWVLHVRDARRSPWDLQ